MLCPMLQLTGRSSCSGLACRNGNEKGARLLAKSLVRLRGQRTKVLASSAQLRGVRASIGVSTSTHTCSSSSKLTACSAVHAQEQSCAMLSTACLVHLGCCQCPWTRC